MLSRAFSISSLLLGGIWFDTFRGFDRLRFGRVGESPDLAAVSSSSELEEVSGTLARRGFTDKADAFAVPRNFQFLVILRGTMRGRGPSVQEEHAPSSICFGCGPANENGLRIKSFRSEKGLEMEFMPNDEHQAFPGMVNGGIIGTLLDCHGNWTAAVALMDQSELDEPPCTVTASYSISLRRPTPHGVALRVTSEIVELGEDRAKVSMALIAEDKICATGEGLFVAVKEGHPAFHRWN